MRTEQDLEKQINLQHNSSATKTKGNLDLSYFHSNTKTNLVQTSEYFLFLYQFSMIRNCGSLAWKEIHKQLRWYCRTGFRQSFDICLLILFLLSL